MNLQHLPPVISEKTLEINASDEFLEGEPVEMVFLQDLHGRRTLPKAATTDGVYSVTVIELGGGLELLNYTPESLGIPENRKEFNYLFSEAAAKLGYIKARRYRTGWRKVRWSE